MSLKHFINEVEKGLPSPVYLLYADDPYLLKEAYLMVSLTIPEQERDFCFSSFDLSSSEKSSLDQIIDAVNTIAFMGKRQIVVIENIQDILKKDIQKLEDYILKPSQYSVLILLHEGSLKDQFKGFTGKIKGILLDMRQKEMPLWIKEKAKQKGLALTDATIEYLIDLTGGDVGTILSEIEKISLSGKKHIGIDDIKEIATANGDYNVFDLIKALEARDYDKVFSLAAALGSSTEPSALLGAINWHYGKVFSKEPARSAYHQKVFTLLKDADISVKTSGSFPLEYLFIRLLQI